MKKLYSDSISNDSFNIYFPLHVPLDYALTIRAPKYFDQLQLIEQILEFNLERRFNILIKDISFDRWIFSKTYKKNYK